MTETQFLKEMIQSESLVQLYLASQQKLRHASEEEPGAKERRAALSKQVIELILPPAAPAFSSFSSSAVH